jgi:hypothetical protein
MSPWVARSLTKTISPPMERKKCRSSAKDAALRLAPQSGFRGPTRTSLRPPSGPTPDRPRRALVKARARCAGDGREEGRPRPSHSYVFESRREIRASDRRLDRYCRSDSQRCRSRSTVARRSRCPGWPRALRCRLEPESSEVGCSRSLLRRPRTTRRPGHLTKSRNDEISCLPSISKNAVRRYSRAPLVGCGRDSSTRPRQ